MPYKEQKARMRRRLRRMRQKWRSSCEPLANVMGNSITLETYSTAQRSPSHSVNRP
ncbi:hypothetical protein DPMN_148594 [Dreissena polymorpha]|uniref:Uncharacterized protein n=1 Tax=Dreissena polymorpha TaxID=45954 RepID=A0A9D4J407_DREPO|nr:hypothetical protein DPMN_148594 [Dreissena polymorpha]